MSPLGCTAARDAAPELALGILDGAERAEVLLHVAGCPRCQAYVSELAGVADGLARLAPEVEPPVGFADRVDAEIRGRRWRGARRWVTTVALTAAAAAILAVVGVRVVDSGRSTHPVTAPALRSVAMVGQNGVRVGRVAVSGAAPSSVAVNVDYAVPDGTYALELRQPGTRGHRIGAITVTGGHGQWTGSTSLVTRDDVSLTMVARGGTIVCQASITPS